MVNAAPEFGTACASYGGMNATRKHFTPADLMADRVRVARAQGDHARAAQALACLGFWTVRETHRVATLAGVTCAANDGAGLAPWTVGL